jgi:alpha-1,3-rhamnosyl/mannosyltransferase
VVRTGWLEPTILAALLQEAAVLAYPSVYEGFGFPPLQAMAAGVPVVATRAGSLPEVLGDGALLVEVGDTDALAQAVGSVLDDPTLHQRLVAAGTARAASFSWGRCGDELARLYRDVARGTDG